MNVEQHKSMRVHKMAKFKPRTTKEYSEIYFFYVSGLCGNSKLSIVY